MRIWNVLLVLSLLSLVLGNDVTELNDQTFDEFIKTHSHVLVYFYAPWCSHCMEFAPIYEKIAAAAKEDRLPFAFAKIDANSNYQTREANGVTAYPTMKAYINGVPIMYRGDETSPQEVVEFLAVKSGPLIKVLKTKDEVLQVIGGRGLRTILVSDDPTVIKEYEKGAVASTTKNRFYRTTEALGKELIPEAMPFPGMVLYKDYDEKKLVHRPVLGKTMFKEALKDNMVPKIGTFIPNLIDFFIGPKPTHKGVVLFHKADDKESLEAFKKLREEVPSKEFVFLTSNYGEEDKEVIRIQFDIWENEMPALVILYRDSTGLHRFIHKDKMQAKEMIEFFKLWEEGKLVEHYRSDEVPKENPGPVYKVVGKSFKEEVLEDPRDVIVKFYATWCPHCQTLAPIYEKLAKQFPKVKFVEIDSTRNEVKGHLISGYPTVKLFLAKDKQNPIIPNSMVLEDLTKFIKEKTGFEPQEEPAETKEEEKVKNEPRRLNEAGAKVDL